MLEEYSDRSKRVIFLTRLKGGQRGAAKLEPEHLIEAILIEDQGQIAKAFGTSDQLMESGLRPRRSFFSPEVASKLLAKLEEILTNSAAIPDSTDMHMSPALGKTLDGAMGIRNELGQEQVEPLHLLAASLSSDDKNISGLWQEAGIDKETVIDAIKSRDYS